MNREEIIKMARESGLACAYDLRTDTDLVVIKLGDLERFAALVAAHEREECAKVCDGLTGRNYEFDMGRLHSGAYIRARGSEVEK